jgi:single-strand DNA-binding protein
MTLRVSADLTVVAQPELKFSNAGKAWLSLRAVSKQRKNVGGKWEDGEPTWLNVVVFGKTAEMIVESGVTKGTRLNVQGRLENRPWTDREGNERHTLEITADNVGLDLAFTAYGRADEPRRAPRPAEPAGFPTDEGPF